MAGPVGAVTLHYSDKHDDLSYNNVLVKGCAKAGIIAFTGDGTNPAVMEATAEALKANGIPAAPASRAFSAPFTVMMPLRIKGLPAMAAMSLS